MTPSRLRFISVVTLAMALVSPTIPKAQSQDFKGWRDYGGGPDNSKFVALNCTKSKTGKYLTVNATSPLTFGRPAAGGGGGAGAANAPQVPRSYMTFALPN